MSKDEQAIEAEIQAKGLNAPRLSPEKIDAVITGEDYHVFPGTTLTVCRLEAAQRIHGDGRECGGQPGELRRGTGKKIARSNARDKIWRSKATPCAKKPRPDGCRHDDARTHAG